MTTVIQPESGAGCLMTQQGVGTSPGYGAIDDRRTWSAAFQEGVYGTSTAVSAGGVSGVVAADFMVTQRAAGAGPSVDINMPGGGIAFVQGDTIPGQGLYAVPVHASIINEAVATADLTYPRVDQVILEARDNVLDASGANNAQTRILTGVPTSGASTTNRAGAAALPGNALLLADFVVPPGSTTTVTNSNIRDRRKWARGAFNVTNHTAGNYAITTTTAAEIDSTNLHARVECSGAPVRLTLAGMVSVDTANQLIELGFFLDGYSIDGTAQLSQVTGPVTSTGYGFTLEYTTTLAAGSHLISPTAWVASGSKTLLATASSPLRFTVEEIGRQNAKNGNGVTTG